MHPAWEKIFTRQTSKRRLIKQRTHKLKCEKVKTTADPSKKCGGDMNRYLTKEDTSI